MSKIEVNAIEPQCGTNLTVGASGDTITFPTGTTIVNNGTQTGFGRTGTVDWDTTPKTATFSAVSGNGYFCNTSGGAFTVNLPAGVAGAIVSLADYAGTFQTNNLTVSPNGSEKIGGTTIDVTLDTEGQSVTLVYVDATQGWITTADSTENVAGNAFVEATGGTITCCGDFKIHTFTGPGTFTVSNAAACAADNLVSYMVVAGGGGAGQNRSGGGGAGGYREVVSPTSPYTGSPTEGYATPGNRITVTATGYPIVVGGGGAGGTAPTVNGTNGSTSTFSTINSAGGGGGMADGGIPTGGAGAGGSGGAGSNSQPGGAGNTPPVTPSQGNNGAASISGAGGGGGGGAGAVGGTMPSPTVAGEGGTGVGTEINPSPTYGTPGPSGPLRYFAGGGGGGIGFPTGISSPSIGGGGGGIGGDPDGGGVAPAGAVNTGGGGGGTGEPSGSTGGAGGSGIVIIRYKFQ